MAVKTNGFMEDSLREELMKVVLSLALKWGDVIEKGELQVDRLKGAMTNEIYRISWLTNNQDSSRTVLVRIYGEGVDLFFNRDDEIKIFEFMSTYGHGPLLLGKFSEGRVEEFIHARTLSANDLRDPEISALIATKLKEFHAIEMPGLRNVVLWERLRKWLSEAKILCSPKRKKEIGLDEVGEEITWLENEISEEQEIGFCHNDLQYGNIMMDEKTNSLTIIDYEYASYNPIAYDIANHFCEMAANYHTQTPHVLDYSNYPAVEERHRFIRAYLTSQGHEPSEDEVEQLAFDAEKYCLANHIFWGLWGTISN